MLAGDVASAHGHEFSPTPAPAGTTPQGQPLRLGRRLTLPRAVLPSTRQRSPHDLSPFHLGPRARRATTPVRVASVQLTMAELREEPEDELEEEAEPRQSQDSLSGYTMPGAFHGSVRKQDPLQIPSIIPIIVTSPESLVQTTISPPESSHPGPMILFPMTRTPPMTAAADEESMPALTKRARGPKTYLRFAHPPPPSRPLGKTGILRPKILLQLQQRRQSGFHKPLYEVLPANRFAPRTKLGQKFHRLHRGKDGLDADDLVVINAEDHNISDTNSEEIELSDSKAVVGVISPTSAATLDTTVAEFTLDNTVWRIRAAPNGAVYTIESQGDFPQSARWYIPKRKRSSVIAGTSVAPAVKEARKFYFTTILPGSKQHPIIASMTEVCLEMNDSYTIASRQETVVTDELTRKLVIISGAWVFFMQGWSNNYKVSQKRDSCPRPHHSRAYSLPLDITKRRSIFTTDPSRSPSLPTPMEGLSSSSIELFKSATPEPQIAPDTLSVPEGTFVFDRSTSQSTEATVVVTQKVSQTSQATVSDTSTQSHQPGSKPTASIPPQVDTTATPTSQAPSPAIVPRARAIGDIEAKAAKRRSWSHHEVPQWVRQGSLGSLSRSMSSRLKRERPSLLSMDASSDMPIASVEEQPSPRQDRGLRHLRRISEHLRHSKPTSIDAANVTPSILRPYTPHPSFAHSDRPPTAKSSTRTDTIPSDTANPCNAPPTDASSIKVMESKGTLQLVPFIMDGSASATQSTETLPDPGQASWWQQYDQFLKQDQHRHFQRLERHVSPVIEELQEHPQKRSQEYPREQFKEQLQKEFPQNEVPDQQIPNFTSMVSPTSPMSSAAGSRRLGSWKEKLKTKLHA